jgi:two-component system nitrogen regulation sensor histidine kinase NtrY
VQNLLKNATEAIAAVPETDRGEGEITVSLDDEDPDFITLAITDNGKGFPQEGRQRLLEPYMTTRDGGTGLGLAIVSKILEEHGGNIELFDNPAGRGGQVRVRIPKQRSEIEQQPRQRQEARKVAS